MDKTTEIWARLFGVPEKRLRISQRKAGEILGGGPRSFHKYENGDVVVSRSMANLLYLLS